MAKNFQEYELRCAKCDSTDYYHRGGFHIWNRYHCESCYSNFHTPRPVSNRTKSSRYDSHRRYDATYENLNKSRNKKVLWGLGIFLVGLIVIILLIIKVGMLTTLFGVFGLILLWLFIAHPPRRRRQRGKRLF